MENPYLPNESIIPESGTEPKKNPFKLFFNTIFFLLFLIILGYIFFITPPNNFPTDKIITIEEGTNLRQLSLKLKTENVIRSRIAYESFVILYDGEKHILPGDYLFEKKIPVYEIARRVSEGKYGLGRVKVTIPEGFNIPQIGDAFVGKLSKFNLDNFLVLAKDKEGYLFPDTYFFLRTDNEENVIKYMSDNFKKKTKAILSKIDVSGKSEKDIIIMASIIEEEAKGDADRALISGILWKRISIGMPLQADAAPVTYKEKGLPETPISNPGLESIKASLYPESSPYLYYLHDKEGVIHFARNFEEHKSNKFKYLK